MHPLLAAYLRLLETVDCWFSGCLGKAGAHIRCGEGCSECCRGLFDITLLDALLLQTGVRTLPPAEAAEVRRRAQALLPLLTGRWPGFSPPYLLNDRPDADWKILIPPDDVTPCVFLDDAGRCRVYAFRPLTCRLHGLPLVDCSGEVFDEEWCSRNFVGIDPLGMKELRGEFRRLFGEEVRLLRRLALQLTGRPPAELDTLIPCAVLVEPGDYENCL